MKRFLFLLLALSLGLNAGLLYVRIADRPHDRGGPAGPPPPDRHGPQESSDVVIEEHLDAMSQHLALEAPQRTAIHAILTDHLPTLMEIRHEADEANRQIAEIFTARQFDAERFAVLTRQVSLSRARMDSVSSVMLLEEAQVLTLEQRTMFAEVATSVYLNPPGQQPPDRRGPERRGPDRGGPERGGPGR